MAKEKEKKEWKIPDVDGWVFVFGQNLLLAFAFFLASKDTGMLRVLVILNLATVIASCFYYFQSNRMMGRLVVQLSNMSHMMLGGSPPPAEEALEMEPKHGHNVM